MAKKTTRKTAAPRASSKDAENNKGMAIIAYLGILFLIPLLTGDYKKSAFLKFHTNQGFVLFLTAVALWIVWSIIWAIFIRGIIYSYSWGMWGFMSTLSWLVWLAILALCIIGIINAANGKMKPLPLIGKFTIIK
ncbi:MAG: hypothetical protein LBQ89_09110 [Treponema sp.]|jgi:uncharacterized membrane protein|nr:hypothetical protein [Treponema sp.]